MEGLFYLLCMAWVILVGISVNAFRVKAPASGQVLKITVWCTVILVIVYALIPDENIKKIPKTPEQIHQEIVEKQFSPWDGSHRQLERYIKSEMHNPSSYKHVQTRHFDNVKYLVVQTKFSGTNAFGGVVTNIVRAKVDLEGNVLEILDQQ